MGVEYYCLSCRWRETRAADAPFPRHQCVSGGGGWSFVAVLVALYVALAVAGCTEERVRMVEANARGMERQRESLTLCCTAFRWMGSKYTDIDCRRWEPCQSAEQAQP